MSLLHHTYVLPVCIPYVLSLYGKAWLNAMQVDLLEESPPAAPVAQIDDRSRT